MSGILVRFRTVISVVGATAEFTCASAQKAAEKAALTLWKEDPPGEDDAVVVHVRAAPNGEVFTFNVAASWVLNLRVEETGDDMTPEDVRAMEGE